MKNFIYHSKRVRFIANGFLSKELMRKGVIFNVWINGEIDKLKEEMNIPKDNDRPVFRPLSEPIIVKGPKYKLKWYQWLEVPILWVLWYTCDNDKRKSTFGLVLKSMEHHGCKFDGKTFYEGGYKFTSCSYEGCDMCVPED